MSEKSHSSVRVTQFTVYTGVGEVTQSSGIAERPIYGKGERMREVKRVIVRVINEYECNGHYTNVNINSILRKRQWQELPAIMGDKNKNAKKNIL